jgi:CBS domain containing-hemolysin-like protein
LLARDLILVKPTIKCLTIR